MRKPAGNLPGDSSSAPASFQVQNKKFAQLLRPEDANSANGTRLVLYPAQLWKCMAWRFHPAGESAFRVQNYFTSKAFAAETQTDKKERCVSQVPFGKHSGEGPVWQFTKLADGSYKIADAKSGMVLTAAKEENGATVRIVVEAWREKDEQKWELLPSTPSS